MTKTVYAFDRATGAFTGPVDLDDSDKSPLEKDVYLIPGACMETAPPTPETGQWPFVVDGEWVLQQLAADPGEESQEPATPEERKALLRAAATAKRFEIETGGIDLPSGTRLDTTREDQNSVANAISLAEIAGVTSVDFKAASGWATVSIPQLKQIGAAIGLHKQACYSAERAHHEAIDVLADAGLDTYDLEAGWPTADDLASLFAPPPAASE